MSASKRILNMLGQVDEKYIEEAAPGIKAHKKLNCIKWGAMAACLALVAVVSIGMFQGGWLGASNDTATLSNGETITFVKSAITVEAVHFDEDMTAKELTAEELKALFGNLNVVGAAYFKQNNPIGFEGKIDNMKIVITTSDVTILDAIVFGIENITMVDDVPVTAGYFITKANSQGIKTSVYYATFELGDNTIYIEHAGTEDNSETVKKELVTAIQNLIQNGKLNLNQLQK